MIQCLFIGDIVGSESVRFISNNLSRLKSHYRISLVIANAENAGSSGYGLTPSICQSLINAGVDVITTGNHVWDDPTILNTIKNNPLIVCPANMADTLFQQGFCLVPWGDRKILIINVLGSRNMTCKSTPLLDAILPILEKHPLIHPEIAGIIVDIHGACPIEKKALAHMLDGKVSCVLGTHTHVPTLDFTILPLGTGFQSDAGMVGSDQSLGGFDPKESFYFLSGIRRKTWKPLKTNINLCGTIFRISSITGVCEKIFAIRANQDRLMEFDANDF